MHVLVLVFVGSIVVLLLAVWAVVRVVRQHGKRRAAGAGSLNLNEVQPEVELEHDDLDEH